MPPSSLATITVFVGLLLTIGSIEAATRARTPQPRLIDLRVHPAGFGGASPADIKAVLQSAAENLARYCPNTPLPGIDVYHCSDYPQTEPKRSGKGRIAIGLAVRDNHWAQYAFQFAHEYCHALINYNREQLAPHVQQTNLWLEESLCETASLFTLRELSRSWRIAAPYPVWREYAPWFSVYVKERLDPPEHRLPPGTPFIVWFRANEAGLRRDGTRRDRNTIIAAQLLRIFEQEPEGWGSLAFFRRTSRQSLTQQFMDWHSRCPPNLKRFLEKLAAVFDVQI